MSKPIYPGLEWSIVGKICCNSFSGENNTRKWYWHTYLRDNFIQPFYIVLTFNGLFSSSSEYPKAVTSLWSAFNSIICLRFPESPCLSVLKDSYFTWTHKPGELEKFNLRPSGCVEHLWKEKHMCTLLLPPPFSSYLHLLLLERFMHKRLEGLSDYCF